jgi:hypothetical protein
MFYKNFYFPIGLCHFLWTERTQATKVLLRMERVLLQTELASS